MRARPLFSVVIPTYNRCELVKRTLESVWWQTLRDYEVIVVDDGSNDDTLDYLNSLRSRVQVLQQANRGPGAARNTGVRTARGTYIAFLDSDDLWFPWSLATYEELIQQHGSPAFIAGKPLRFEREQELTGLAASCPASEKFPDYFASGDEWRWWGVSSFVIRSDLLKAAGGFAEGNVNGEDADLAMKLGTAPGFVQVTAPFTFGYREHGNKLTGELSKSVAGIWHKIRAERTGTYPGGRARARERWKILTRHIRPVTIACLNQGLRGDAWAFYFASFRWHLVLRRGKYLAGFPLVALASSTPRAEPPSSSTVRTGRSRDQNPFGVLIERCRGGCGR